jgi:hypothetical protein
MFNVFGPLLEFLVTPGAFAVIRGIVPPGVAIPLHSHADPEVLLVLEGELNVLMDDGDSSCWLAATPGETTSHLGARSMLCVMLRRGQPSYTHYHHKYIRLFP